MLFNHDSETFLSLNLNTKEIVLANAFFKNIFVVVTGILVLVLKGWGEGSHIVLKLERKAMYMNWE